MLCFEACSDTCTGKRQDETDITEQLPDKDNNQPPETGENDGDDGKNEGDGNTDNDGNTDDGNTDDDEQQKDIELPKLDF